MKPKKPMPKTAKTLITHAGMRREIQDLRSGLYVPTEKSVIESLKWVEYTKL